MGSALLPNRPPRVLAEQGSHGVHSSIRAWCVRLLCAAFVLRVAVFLIASGVFHVSPARFAAKGDGASYLVYAKAILGDRSQLTEYDRRVFPGYPALIAAAHELGLSLPLAAILIDWLSAGIAAAAALAVFRDVRVGLAMLYLLPHYLTNSSLAMSEAPLLAFTLLGLLLALRRRPTVSGALLGYACLIRPMACFAIAGLLAVLAARRRWRRLSITLVGSVIVAVCGLLVAQWRTSGDLLQSLRVYRDSPRAYGGRIFEWPFHSLLTVPLREQVAAGFVVYIYAHVAIVLFACGWILWRTLRRARTTEQKSDLDLIVCVWLLGNTLFQLCIGSTWGFRHFPRFAIPAQPALFWALRPMLPRSRWPWWTAGAGICYMAVVCVNLTP